MTLIEFIKRLESMDPNELLPIGIRNPHSYRGYYNELAFEPTDPIPVREAIKVAASASGMTFTAYKGGEYTMTNKTNCWLANWSELGEEIDCLFEDGDRHRVQLENAELRLENERLRAALREIAENPTGGVGCNPEGFVKKARAALEVK